MEKLYSNKQRKQQVENEMKRTLHQCFMFIIKTRNHSFYWPYLGILRILKFHKRVDANGLCRLGMINDTFCGRYHGQYKNKALQYVISSPIKYDMS